MAENTKGYHRLRIYSDTVGDYVKTPSGQKHYFLTTEVVAGTTPTNAAAGSLVQTTHASGAGKTFYSDGEKWLDAVSRGVKVWRGILSQTGTSAPTATVLENTLGVNITFTRAGAGNFTVVASGEGIFNANKTLFFAQAPWSTVCAIACIGGVNDANTAFMFTLTELGAYTDFAGDKIFLQIIHYP